MSAPVVALLTNSLSGGGAERAATILANLLADAGVRPVLLPCRSGPADLVSSNVEVVALEKRPGSGIRGLAGTLAGVQRAVRSLRPDIVHAHCELPELLAASLPPGSGRFCVTEHARDPWNQHPRVGRGVRRALALRGTTWAVPQPDMPVWSRPGQPTFHVANPLLGVTGRWTPPGGERRLRLVAVGRLAPLKRFDWLIRAVAARAEALELTVVGDGDERQSLEALAAELGAPVTFAGYQSDPWALALQHDLYVTPSATEADPLSLAEALLHEMPVLASDIPGHRGQGLSAAQLFADQQGLAQTLDDVVAGGVARLLNPSAAASLRAQRVGSAVAAAQLAAYGLA
jgi:hypothetical protein